MIVKGILVAVVIALLSLVFEFFRRSGLFTPILFNQRSTPDDLRVVVKSYKGSYESIGSIYSEMFRGINEKLVEKEDRNEFYTNVQVVGLYHDDERDCGKNNTRYSVGIGVNYLNKESAASNGVVEHLLEKGYKEIKMKKMNSFMTLFPFNGITSILIAVKRVYPAADKYANENYGVDRTSRIVKMVCEITHEDVTEFYFILDEPSDEVKSLVKDL